MNFVFAGTPDFAARVLRELVEAGSRPSLVVSQPDRPKGRGRPTCCPSTVLEARSLGIDALQTEDLNDEKTVEMMAASGAEALVIASFGQLLRPSVLERFLCLNIHASLLPAYRGAAPVERAIAAGEERIGVTIMRVTEPLDEGPWALKCDMSVSLRDDAGSVTEALAVLGAMGMGQVLTGLDDGTVVWREQRGETNYAHKLCAEDTVFDPALSARALHDRVRSLSPCVGVRAQSGSVELKVWRTWPYGLPGLEPVPGPAVGLAGERGRVVIAGEHLYVGCSAGVLELLFVQPVGRPRMQVSAFLRGYGARLGETIGPVVRAAPDDELECG